MYGNIMKGSFLLNSKFFKNLYQLLFFKISYTLNVYHTLTINQSKNVTSELSFQYLV